jgi:hypothetical protein
MSQLNLFQPEAPPVARRPANPAFMRKHLNRLVNMARRAERLPWSVPEAQSWARRFPELTKSLPEDEARTLIEAFTAELARLMPPDLTAPT